MNGRKLKRILDLALVILSAPIWIPLLLAIALLVRIKLGTPLFFRQPRPGCQERIFELIKFRTMRDDRDASHKLMPDADRLPPFGRWLRSTSLDELPELWNVLKGEMSLVGPRPLLVRYLPRYSVEERKRHLVRPGLTGWAQINGRNAISWKEKFALDVWYVENRTLALDVKIIFQTAWQVVTRRGVSAQGEATMQEFNPE